METVKRYDNFPAGIVILANAFPLALYALGFYIISGLGLTFSFMYLVYIMIFEYRLLKFHCTNCWYYGKTCGTGAGKLSSLMFRKGDPSKFCAAQMTWKDMIPDMMVSAIPLLIGIVLLIMHFNIILLSALVLLIVLTTAGNAYTHGSFTCKYCKQRDLGCPAESLFNKNKQA